MNLLVLNRKRQYYPSVNNIGWNLFGNWWAREIYLLIKQKVYPPIVYNLTGVLNAIYSFLLLLLLIQERPIDPDQPTKTK